MTTFTLDTSGAVYLEGKIFRHALKWPDLDAFTQGYVEALFAAVAAQRTYPDAFYKAHGMRHARFSDLSPEALAMILADCAAMQEGLQIASNFSGGRVAWEARQSGWKDWGTGPRKKWTPPTVSLGDDGKVKLEVKP